MRKAMAVTIFAIFVLGVVIPISSADSKNSHFFQAIKDVFHYFPGETKATAKETPTKFEKTMKKELKYPETKTETKSETK